jgi:hypothetical protein
MVILSGENLERKSWNRLVAADQTTMDFDKFLY